MWHAASLRTGRKRPPRPLYHPALPGIGGTSLALDSTPPAPGANRVAEPTPPHPPLRRQTPPALPPRRLACRPRKVQVNPPPRTILLPQATESKSPPKSCSQARWSMDVEVRDRLLISPKNSHRHDRGCHSDRRYCGSGLNRVHVDLRRVLNLVRFPTASP